MAGVLKSLHGLTRMANVDTLAMVIGHPRFGALRCNGHWRVVSRQSALDIQDAGCGAPDRFFATLLWSRPARKSSRNGNGLTQTEQCFPLLLSGTAA
jgi:hypothetical protein